MKGQSEVTVLVFGTGAGGAERGGVVFSLCSRDIIFVISHVAGGGFGGLGRNLGSVREGGVRGDHGSFSRPDRSSGKDISKLGSRGLRYFRWLGSTHTVPVCVFGSPGLAKDALWSFNRHGTLEASEVVWLLWRVPLSRAWEASRFYWVSSRDRLGPVRAFGLGGVGSSERLDPSFTWLQPARESSRVPFGARVVCYDGLGSHPTSSTPGMARGRGLLRPLLSIGWGPTYGRLLRVRKEGNPTFKPPRGGGRFGPSRSTGGAGKASWDSGRRRARVVRGQGPSGIRSTARGPGRLVPKTTFKSASGLGPGGLDRKAPRKAGRGGTGPISGRHGLRRATRSVTFGLRALRRSYSEAVRTEGRQSSPQFSCAGELKCSKVHTILLLYRMRKGKRRYKSAKGKRYARTAAIFSSDARFRITYYNRPGAHAYGARRTTFKILLQVSAHRTISCQGSAIVKGREGFCPAKLVQAGGKILAEDFSLPAGSGLKRGGLTAGIKADWRSFESANRWKYFQEGSRQRRTHAEIPAWVKTTKGKDNKILDSTLSNDVRSMIVYLIWPEASAHGLRRTTFSIFPYNSSYRPILGRRKIYGNGKGGLRPAYECHGRGENLAEAFPILGFRLRGERLAADNRKEVMNPELANKRKYVQEGSRRRGIPADIPARSKVDKGKGNEILKRSSDCGYKFIDVKKGTVVRTRPQGVVSAIQDKKGSA